MPFAAGSSVQAELPVAVAEACRQIVPQLAGARADLTFVFATHDYQGEWELLPALLQAALPTRCLLGCSAEGVIVNARELETGPALVVWSAALPSTELLPFRVEFERTPDGILCTGVPEWQETDPQTIRAVFALGEPYTCAPQSFLERLQDELPGVPIIGGMASGAAGPGENRLFFSTETVMEGAVAVALRGGPAVRTLVSQGCRPIGAPFVVTRAEQNVIAELGGRPALERLREVYEQLSPHDKELLSSGVHVGLAINEYRDRFAHGDFLIANVLGARRDSGAIAIGNLVRVGQTVQFHVRDAASADDDLQNMLAQQRRRQTVAPAGALLFSCNGRGRKLFRIPHHDAATVQAALGPLPLAGFFANGELGPVGGRNYIHGFTASLALFEETPEP